MLRQRGEKTKRHRLSLDWARNVIVRRKKKNKNQNDALAPNVESHEKSDKGRRDGKNGLLREKKSAADASAWLGT